MKRRTFLRGVGATGGAALAAGLARPAEGARPGALDRLKQAQISVVARATPPGTGAVAEMPLGDGFSARRELHNGTLALRAAPAAGGRDAVDLFVTFRGRSGAPAGTISLALDFGAWSLDNYLMLPGACYAGNRFASRFVGYPPLLTEPADIGPHVPPIVTDVPRLNLHPGPSGLEIAAADLATPAAAIFSPIAQLGIIVLVDPATSVGRTGITVSESDDRTRATIAVATPFAPASRRTQSATPAPAPRDRPAPAHLGESVTLRARVAVFDCPSVDKLTERLFALRKALTGPTARAHTLPFSAAFAAHEARVNARFVPQQGFFAIGARDSAYSIWQTGWTGGLGATLPLLAAGDKRSRARARQTISFAVSGQAPSGFFHGVSDGKTWYDDGFTAPLPPAPADAWPPRAPPYQHPRWHLVRRSADALALLVRQLTLLEQQAAAAPRDEPSAPLDPTWGKAARLCAEALARLWERHRQFGQFVDVDSGELIVGGSSSAGIAPAALAQAAAYFKEPRYLQIAEESGRHFYERFVEVGMTCGGPGDALQCPDSESAAALLESFVVLFEATGDRRWLERARSAAHLLASWVISYDAPPSGHGCPPPGPIRATGAVFTDAQSRIGAPGYVQSSGAALFRLYRATGEVALLELLRDTVHNLAQYLPPREQPDVAVTTVTRLADGCARADTRDWLAADGGVVPAAGLYDAIALLSYTEIPSVYAQTDAGFVFAFDHVEARVKERLAGRLVVALRNPTASEAILRLYAESADDAARRLAPGAILGAPTAVVPPGGAVEVTMPPMTARR
ncbi:MAG TPA: hypothetical protein VH853_12480 [Polyangia bacterium]|jgi:hypothetical protein|nr:hypothetical protein [Polyangia bacterium]